MTIVCDFHIHTTKSDGIYTPSEIVEKAIHKGLKAIAITDHDTLDGIDEAITSSKGRIEVIPGIELSTEVDGRDTHILGLFVNHKDEEFLKVLDTCRQVRYERGEKIVKKLIQAGIDIEFKDVQECAGTGVIGRMHVAKVLYQKGHVSSIQDAFRLYLGDGSEYYVPKFKITPKEAFRLIKKSGGICMWAHPGCQDMDYLIKDFIADGLDGIEVWHPKHTNSQIHHYYELAKFYNLKMTGGSDYHGHRVYDLGHTGLTDEYYLKLGKGS